MSDFQKTAARLARELKELQKKSDFLVSERSVAEREAEAAHRHQKELHLSGASAAKLTAANEAVATKQRDASAFGPAIDELDVAISQKRAELEVAEERVAALQRADQIDAGLANLAATDDGVISALKARIEAYEAFGTGGAAEGAKQRVELFLREVIGERRTIDAIYRPTAQKLRIGDVKISKSAPAEQQETAPQWPPANAKQATVSLPTGVGYRVPVGAFGAGA